MSKKFLVLGVVVLVAIGYYFAVYLSSSKGGNNDQLDIPKIEKLEIVQVFSEGVHTLTGDVMVPTPCHALSYEVKILKESYPENIRIEFTSNQMSEICAAVITPAPFEIEVTASEKATFEAIHEGVDLLVEMKAPVVVGEKVFSNVIMEKVGEVEKDELPVE